MKKLVLALVCFASVAFFASCNPVVENPEPTIAVMSAENYVNGTAEAPTIIDVNDPNAINLKYGFHVESNSQTKKQLATLKITFEEVYGEETYTSDTTIDLSGQSSFDFDEFIFVQPEREIIGTVTITAVVTDVNNQTNTATIVFQLDQPALPLIGNTIQWVRNGSNVEAETEAALKAIGLKWAGSYKDVMVTIRVLENEDVDMYICPGDDYATITTDVEKFAYFANLTETGESVDRYRNITTNNSADYNDMLAVRYGDIYTLIHITHATIEAIYNNNGVYERTDITITGEIK